MKKETLSKIIISDKSTLRDVMNALNDWIMGIVLIVDNEGVMKGLFTDGDIRRLLLKGATLDDQVSIHMRSTFVSGRADLTREDNVKLLNEKIKHLPILDSERRPVDLISWAEMWRLPVTEPYLGGNELKYVSECITSNWISSQGHYIEIFENMFAKYLNLDHAITTSSGTTALHLGLKALGVSQGDEVIVPDITFAACANVVLHCGAIPVFVDVSKDTWTMDPNLIEKAITNKTKAIMPVHLYGHPCDMDPIMEIAKKSNLYVIEDCAEALGALYKSRQVGTIGDIGCFSFFANKVITTGEGGMVTTNSPELKERMVILRDHGMSKTKRYWHDVAGFNYRMTNMQAAIGVAQMECLETFLSRREVIAERYSSNLSGVNGVTLPPNMGWAKNIYWLYTILIDENSIGMTAEQLMGKMKAEGVDTRPVFPPLHLQPPYPNIDQEYPVSIQIARQGISLPTGNDITIGDVDMVCNILKKILRNTAIVKKYS